MRRLGIYDPIDNLDDLQREIGYLSTVRLRGLRTTNTRGRDRDLPLRLFSHQVKTKHTVDYTVE